MPDRCFEPLGNFFKKSDFSIFVVSKNNDLLKPIHEIPAIRNPCKAIGSCWNGYGIFYSGFRNRHGIKLSFAEYDPVILVIALEHSKQNRLCIFLTPLFISAFFLGILRVTIFNELHFSVLVKKWKYKNISIFALHGDLISLCSFF